MVRIKHWPYICVFLLKEKPFNLRRTIYRQNLPLHFNQKGSLCTAI